MADILKAKDFIRVRLTRNGTVLYDQSYVSEDDPYTEHTTERAVLSTNMATSQAVNLGGVATAGRIFLETDRGILVGLGITPANKVQVGSSTEGGVLMVTGSFSHLWVRNTGLQEARIEYVVTD